MSHPRVLLILLMSLAKYFTLGRFTQPRVLHSFGEDKALLYSFTLSKGDSGVEYEAWK